MAAMLTATICLLPEAAWGDAHCGDLDLHSTCMTVSACIILSPHKAGSPASCAYITLSSFLVHMHALSQLLISEDS